MAAKAAVIPGSSGVLAGGQQGMTAAGTQYVWGWSLRETGAAAAVIRLRETGVIGGNIVATIAFVASQSKELFFSDGGVEVTGKIYVEIVSGAVEGVVYVS